MQNSKTRAAWRLLCGAALLACGAAAQAQAGPPPSPAQAPAAAEAAQVFVQTGHSLQITAARLSPDGRRMAACDGFGAVIAWDPASGRQYREVQRHTGLCMGLAFTPDGEAVISSGGARTGQDVVMSRWLDGRPLQVWQGHAGLVRAVLATPDGQGAWSLGDTDGLLLWRVGTAAPVRRVPALLPGEDAARAPESVALAAAAGLSSAFVARADGSILRLDLSGTAPAALVATRNLKPSALAVSPDGRVLAVAHGDFMGTTDHDVVLLDAASGAEISRLPGHKGSIQALAFSADGRLIASAAQLDINAMMAPGGAATVREHEALRVWDAATGRLLGEARNPRGQTGTPFLHGSVSFGRSPQGATQVALALWDEAARLYELQPAPNGQAATGLHLLHSLEGRGLAPRQLQADAAGRLLVTDGRLRVKRSDKPLDADTARREFDGADWTPEREKRLREMYALQWPTALQRAAVWNMANGRLERVVDWQRGAPSDVGLDAQGRFVSLAPLFPSTTLVSPFRARLVREATVDAEGQLGLRHFGYEPAEGAPGDLFLPLPGQAPAASAPAGTPTAYASELAVMSPTQRWTAVAGLPIGAERATPPAAPRVFVLERLADGRREHRRELAVPGTVRALAIAADERTLWAAGSASGAPQSPDHVSWLMAVDLPTGAVQRRWDLPRGVTVDRLAAHPGGRMALVNGDSRLTVYDKAQDAVKHRIDASLDRRGLKAVTLSPDGALVATADNAGYTALWDWPQPQAAPARRWGRVLPSPSPQVLAFAAGTRRLAAGADDGSVRLLDNAGGAEVARMVRFDNDEWITIIPEGYFVASQEGDRWVNVRMDGKVYGIGQFYDVFYRPDIVERRLAGQEIQSLITVTLEDALRQPPPAVALALAAQPAGAAAGAKVRLAVRAVAQGGGVGEVRVLHNGKLVEVLNRAVVQSGLAAASGPRAAVQAPVPAALPIAAQARDAGVAEETVTRALRLAVQAQQDPSRAAPALQQLSGEVEVELVPGENAFSVIGFNAPGTLNARPVTQVLSAAGAAPAPRVFVLAVGINQFASPNAMTLSGAVKDSTDFTAALRARLGATYRDAPVVVKMLHDAQATRAGLTAALAQLQKDVRPGDLLVWFMASHGTLDNNGGYGVILHDWDGRASEASLFSAASILEASRSIKAFNQLVILDTCHAGGVNSLVRGLYDARLAVLARNMGLHVFASASDTEEAIDSYQGNGLFTHTLLKGLATPVADRNADRQVTVNELGDYARRETMRIARAARHSQEPLLMNFGKDVTVYATD